MIVLHDYKICFLRKPKCGSTSLEKAIRKCNANLRSKIFYSTKTLVDCGWNHHHFNWVHSNLDSAIVFLQQKHKQNIDDWTFIVTAREPIDMFKSLYFFDISRQNHRLHGRNIWHQFSCPQSMMKTVHYKMLTDKVFFNNHQEVNLKLFKLEDISSLEKYLHSKFNIDIDFPQANINQARLINRDIDVSHLESQIYKDFYLYTKFYNIDVQ